jgi:type IV secretion system protein VirD4
MKHFTHSFQTGLAIGKMLVTSVTENVLDAIDSFDEQDSKIYNASFGDERELLSASHGGFNLTGSDDGFITRAVSSENVLVTGAIGSGKTSGLVIPSCLGIKNASMIITDPSGQALSKCASRLVQEGVTVKVFKPDDPYHSDNFNPFYHIKSKSDAFKMAHVLVSCILKVGTGDNFWFLQAVTTLYIFISIVMTLDDPFRNISTIRQLLIRFTVDPSSLDKLFIKRASPELFQDWLNLNKTEEKVLKSILATTQSALQLWFEEAVAKSTCINNIDFEALRKKPHAIFVVNATANSKVYAPLMSLFFELAFKSLMSKLPEKNDLDVFMILDEVGTLRFESLGDILNNNRKYRIPTMTLWQSQEIIEHQFGIGEAESIRNASRTKVFLNGVGLKASRELEELLGKTEYTDSDGKTKVKPLMTAQQIRLMKPDEAIIVSGTLKPLHVRVTPFFRAPLLEMKTKLPPFVVNNSRVPHSIPVFPLP